MPLGYSATATSTMDAPGWTELWAVEILTPTPLRFTDNSEELQVTGNTFAPWTISITGLNVGERAGQPRVTIGNFDLSGPFGIAYNVSGYDLAVGLEGRDIAIWRVLIDEAGTRSDEEVFRGQVDAVEAADEKAVVIRAVPGFALRTRPGALRCLPTCRWRQFKGPECGYSGTATSCDRTIDTCKALGNAQRFGGFRHALPAGTVIMIGNVVTSLPRPGGIRPGSPPPPAPDGGSGWTFEQTGPDEDPTYEDPTYGARLPVGRAG